MIRDLIEYMRTQLEGEPSIGPSSNVKLGLILTVLGLVGALTVGGVAAVSAKTSEYSTKLDNIQQLLTATITKNENTEKRVEEHIGSDAPKWEKTETRLSVLEISGSSKVRALEVELQKLRQDFEVYKATRDNNKPNRSNP